MSEDYKTLKTIEKYDIPKNEDEKFINSYRRDPNNISRWFPKIENCGIAVPRTFIFDVPVEVCKAYFMDNMERDIETVYQFVKEIIKKLPRDMFFMFMKNGTFSNKFNFSDCMVRKEVFEITQRLININYTAEMLGADGLSEVAFREFIGDHFYLSQNCYRIYNGMPLRPEFRVFYDFDNKKVLYSVNYWDYDYCFKAISRDLTDKIVYETAYPEIEKEYNSRRKEVEELVANHMCNVDMRGIWSVDIMYNKQNDKYYLIDMATANTSAYWKPDKVGD